MLFVIIIITVHHLGNDDDGLTSLPYYIILNAFYKSFVKEQTCFSYFYV